VREESQNVTVVDVRIDRMVVPDSPYAMWLRGELDDYLHVPDSSKVEVIGGRIVVTPAPGRGGTASAFWCPIKWSW
jgi:hypothetical protein